MTEEDKARGRKMKTPEVMEVLRKHCRKKGAIYLEELRAGAGFGVDSERRIDSWSIQAEPSKKHERVAYEVKVSRADFRADMRKPQKQRPARLVSNRFFYVSPEGLIKPAELPVWAGLLEVREVSLYGERSLELVPTVAAPLFETEPPNWSFVVSLVRHAAKHAGTERFGQA